MVIAAVGLVACADASHGPGDTTAPTGPPIDLVFVVHDAPSMAKVQADLMLDLPGFWVRLDATGLDYRIAVTTTGRDFTFDVATPFGTSHGMQTGANGTFSRACGLTKPWIDRSDPDPAIALACAAAVGTAGPTFEMPLGALRDALVDRTGGNTGFHRPGALIGAVIVSDGDDCSYEHPASLPGGGSLCRDMVEPVATYVGFLDELAGARAKWAAVAIAAPGPDACMSAYGTADPAPRLVDFIAQAGPSGTLATICDGDLAAGLDQAVAVFDR